MAPREAEPERLGTGRPKSAAPLSDEEAIARGRAAVASGTDLHERRPATKAKHGTILEGRERPIRDVNRAHAERDLARKDDPASLPEGGDPWRRDRPVGGVRPPLRPGEGRARWTS